MPRWSTPVLLVVFLVFIASGCGGGPPNQQTPNPVPSITSVTPTSAQGGTSGTTVAVAVTNLISSSVVQWNGAPRAPTSTNSNGFTLAITAADLSAPGTATLTVTNPAPGGGTTTYKFTIDPPAAPTLSTVSPSSIPPMGGASNLTATGSNFVVASVVNWNGAARPTTYVSNVQLTAVLTAQDSSTGGTAQVTVTTPSPGGGTSSAQTVNIQYPLPVVTSLTPATATWNSTGAFTLTVNGSNFFPGALVQWNSINRVTTLVSGNQLSAAILASDVTGTAGTTYRVTVTNPTPNAGISAPVSFTIVNPLPALQSLSPNSGYGNTAGLLITVSGQSLAPSGTLMFGSIPISPQYVNAGAVTFNLPINDPSHSSPGAFEVTYANPAPGGGTSNALPFTVMATDPPVTSNILQNPNGTCVFGSPCPFALKNTSRNMRFVIGTEPLCHGLSCGGAPMTDTCNDAPPGCVISTVATVGIDAVLSADGRFVVYSTYSPFQIGGFNVYEQDTCLGSSAPPGCVPQSILISPDNTNTSHHAIQPAVGEDGRFVAFTTDVNIDPSDTNGLNDVYLRDTCIGATSCTPTTVLISQAAASVAADQPVVSPTGRFVGYRTTISGGSPQLAFYDTCLGTGGCSPATYAITNVATAYDVSAVKFGAVSVSGRYVSYSAGTTTQTQQVYVHDTCIGAGPGSCTPSDVLVSVSNNGTPGDNGSVNSVMSADGRYVAFDSNATNLVAHDTNSQPDVFWRDTCIGVSSGCSPRTVRMSVDSNGVQMTGATAIQIRADGQEVALTDFFERAVFAKGPF